MRFHGARSSQATGRGSIRPAVQVGALLLVGILLGTVFSGSRPALAAELRIAAAANLRGTLEEVVARYREASPGGSPPAITFGSSAKLYAQTLHGAPFDLFLSADDLHPQRLEESGHGVADTRFSYAIGRLALWAEGAPAEPSDLKERLEALDFHHLAIATPRLAPYGAAARATLEALGMYGAVEPRLVYGEDVGKAFHFVRSGAADLGFAPLSLVRRFEANGGLAQTWVVPSDLHAPLDQQAILLNDSEGARRFLGFLKSHAAREIFSSHGYDRP